MASRQDAKERQAWLTLDAHLKQYAPSIAAALPADYLDALFTMQYLYHRIQYLATAIIPQKTSEEYPKVFHGFLRLTTGLPWDERGIPPVPNNKIVRCGKLQHLRVQSLSQQVYLLLDHLKTREPGLWRHALTGWNGLVALNIRVPGVFQKRERVYGYVSPKLRSISGCIFISPATVFQEYGKNRDADMVTVLHELAHLTLFARHMENDTPPGESQDPHTAGWLAIFNTFLKYASADLGWTLPLPKDPTTKTGFRYGMECSTCVGA